MKCYAACLGNCSNKQSKEHYISKGIWKNPNIIFKGFAWLNGEVKQLPVKEVARKILCTAHNEALSPLDAIAKQLFLTGERMHTNQHNRGKLKRSAIWKPDRETFNGHILEKLFAKMAVGILQEQPASKWHLTGLLALQPPQNIVETIYSLREFEQPMGLYFVNAVGDKLYNEDEVSIQTMYHPDSKGYIGSVISFRNWQFFINLSDINPNEYTMQSITDVLLGKNASPLVYRIEQINFNTKGKLSGQINIEW